MGSIGFGELVIILLIVLIVFGAGKLPQVGDALGKGLRNFRKATKSGDEPEPEPASHKEEKSA